MLSRWDFEIAVVAWLACVLSVIGLAWLAPTCVIAFVDAVVIASVTANLWHQRQVLYRAGDEFERRVRETLAADIAKWESRVGKVEKDMTDVKSAQVSIGAAWSKGR